MTFLQLCQKVNTITGTQGTISTVTGATGHQATIIDHVTNAWLDIQNLRRDWDFLRAVATVSTVQLQTEYDTDDIFGIGETDPVGSWVNNMLLYNDAPLQFVSKDYYIRNKVDERSEDTPSIIAVDYADNTLHINPPNGVYSLSLHYYKKPQTISADADVPLCPSEFHLAIAYRAAADIGAYIGRSELYATYNGKADSIIAGMMRSQIPSRRIRTSGGIA